MPRLRLSKLFFHELAVGDIGEHPDIVGNTALAIGKRCHGEPFGIDLTVLSPVP
jgi:hypothetical protein